MEVWPRLGWWERVDRDGIGPKASKHKGVGRPSAGQSQSERTKPEEKARASICILAPLPTNVRGRTTESIPLATHSVWFLLAIGQGRYIQWRQSIEFFHLHNSVSIYPFQYLHLLQCICFFGGSLQFLVEISPTNEYFEKRNLKKNPCSHQQ